jgi:hypothetical protein
MACPGSESPFSAGASELRAEEHRYGENVNLSATRGPLIHQCKDWWEILSNVGAVTQPAASLIRVLRVPGRAVLTDVEAALRIRAECRKGALERHPSSASLWTGFSRRSRTLSSTVEMRASLRSNKVSQLTWIWGRLLLDSPQLVRDTMGVPGRRARHPDTKRQRS